jgi:hypothetical protein
VFFFMLRRAVLVLTCAAAVAATSPQRTLVSATISQWTLTLTSLDPVTGNVTQTALTVDHSSSSCDVPFSTPILQMDSAVAAVTDDGARLYTLVECEGIVNSTIGVAAHYLVLQVSLGTTPKTATVLGKTVDIYQDIGNSVHFPTLGWDAKGKLLIIGDTVDHETKPMQTTNRTVVYSTFDPASGEAKVGASAPALCPSCAKPEDAGYLPFTGVGALGDNTVYLRTYEHRWGARGLPNPLLLGVDALTGKIAVNVTLGPAFYSMSRESASGDLVGLGLCCNAKYVPGCPSVCDVPGTAPTFFENATCPGGCAPGASCCKDPGTSSKYGYCMDIPKGGTCDQLPASPGKPVFALLRMSAAGDHGGAGAGRGVSFEQKVIRVYNASSLGGIAGSLATGGALSPDGVYTHPVVFGKQSRDTPPPSEADAPAADYSEWYRRFLFTSVPNPTPGGGGMGLVSINATTGEVLHVAKVKGSIGSFLRYV